MGFCSYSVFCCALLCVHSGLAIILMDMEELVVWLVCLHVSRACSAALPCGAMGLSAVCDYGIS